LLTGATGWKVESEEEAIGSGICPSWLEVRSLPYAV
jgi:hypothetical protein